MTLERVLREPLLHRRGQPVKAFAHLWTPPAPQGFSFIVASPRSRLLPSIRPSMTNPSLGLGEIHPSKSHHIIELGALCASRDDRRRSPTGPATTIQITLTVSILRDRSSDVLCCLPPRACSAQATRANLFAT